MARIDVIGIGRIRIFSLNVPDLHTIHHIGTSCYNSISKILIQSYLMKSIRVFVTIGKRGLALCNIHNHFITFNVKGSTTRNRLFLFFIIMEEGTFSCIYFITFRCTFFHYFMKCLSNFCIHITRELACYTVNNGLLRYLIVGIIALLYVLSECF